MPASPNHARQWKAGLAAAGLAGLALLAAAGQAALQGRAGAGWPKGPAALGQLQAAPLGAGAPASQIRAALIASPLAGAPFLAAGFTRAPDGTAHFAPALLREALRRDPHRPGPRLALMAEAAERGDLTGAVTHLAALRRIDPAVGDALAARLGAHLDNEEQAHAGAQAMAGQPALLSAALAGLAQADRPTALGIAMVKDLPPAALVDPGLRAAAVATLVRGRAYAAARQIAWPGANAPLHSPDFRDLSASGPFGWAITANAAGSADADPAGGLALSAYGRADDVLASQLLALTPGRWRLVLRWQPEGGAAQALALRLRCADEGRELGQLDLPPTGPEQTLTLPLDLPGNGRCEGQYVDFIARVPAQGGGAQGRALRLDALRRAP